MTQAPMPELVAQHGNDLLCLAFFDKGIIDDNVFLPGETIEIGVAVSTPFAAVNDIKLFEWKLESPRKSFNRRLQLAFLKW